MSKASGQLTACEIQYEQMKKYVCNDKNSKWCGIIDPGMGARHYISNVAYLGNLIFSYSNRASKYFHNEVVYADIEKAVDALLRLQFPSGFISLPDCNIDSPPDMGFYVNELVIFYKYIQKTQDEKLSAIGQKLMLFIERACKGLLTGGFHTPNHRCVICCSLAFAYEIFKEEAYKERAYAFLSEELDINESGEWTERSNAIYNPVCDLYLFHVGKIFGESYILDAVNKNLNMMKYLVHPDYTIVTEYSNRQDRAKRYTLNDKYAIIFRLMSHERQDGEFAFLSEVAEDSSLNAYLIQMYRALYDFLDVPAIAPKSMYQIMLNKDSKYASRVVRYRNQKLSITIMEKQKDICYIQYGETRMIGLRFVLGWFGVAAVSFDNLTRTSENTYTMDITLEGSYKEVLPKELTNGLNGGYMCFPNEKRKKTTVMYTKALVEFTIQDDEISIRFVVTDTPDLFAQAIFLFDEDGQITGQDLEAADENNIFLRSGSAQYHSKNGVMQINGGVMEHSYFILRNYVSEPHAKNVLVNMLSPIDKTITIGFSY